MKSIKKILKSSKYKEFSLAVSLNEHIDYLTKERKKITNQEDAYSLIVMALARKTFIGMGYELGRYGQISFFDELDDLINEYKLDQKVIASWVPEIFDQCRYAGDHGDFHDFFTLVLTDKKIYQDYLRAVEPRIFSFDEWFKVIQSFSSPNDAEQAMIKLFLSDDHLERFQGSIYGSEWRMEFMEEVLKFCDKQSLVNVKHSCWKILADEAVYGMNAEWLINLYGYDEIMGPNKDKFEDRYLSLALHRAREGYGDWPASDPSIHSWEFDLDISAFKDTRKLNTFLKLRHKLREEYAFSLIQETLDPISAMHKLYAIYSGYPKVIANNKKLLDAYKKIPDTILVAIKENTVKLETRDIMLLKQESLWKEGMADIDFYLSSQLKEIRLMQEMQLLVENFDTSFITLAKQLQDIGFENFDNKAQEEFRSQFLNLGFEFNYLPKFFDMEINSLDYLRLDDDEFGGMHDEEGNWVVFEDWSEGHDWEPEDNQRSR